MTTDLFDRTRHEMADKVRKLLAQAEDRAATPEEAQAFTMKAQQMMTKYAIDLAMVADVRTRDALVERSWVLTAPYAGHKVSLVNAVARANDCRALYADLDRARKQMNVVGYEADVEWVQTLSASLDVQLAVALTEAMRRRPPRVHGRTYAVGFVHGFIEEVAQRLHHARQQAVRVAEAEVGDSDGPSVALVLLDKQHVVDDEFKARHPGTRSVYHQVRLSSWSGYQPGRAAGSRATLARGAVGNRRQSLTA